MQILRNLRNPHLKCIYNYIKKGVWIKYFYPNPLKSDKKQLKHVNLI